MRAAPVAERAAQPVHHDRFAVFVAPARRFACRQSIARHAAHQHRQCHVGERLAAPAREDRALGPTRERADGLQHREHLVGQRHAVRLAGLHVCGRAGPNPVRAVDLPPAGEPDRTRALRRQHGEADRMGRDRVLGAQGRIEGRRLAPGECGIVDHRPQATRGREQGLQVTAPSRRVDLPPIAEAERRGGREHRLDPPPRPAGRLGQPGPQRA